MCRFVGVLSLCTMCHHSDEEKGLLTSSWSDCTARQDSVLTFTRLRLTDTGMEKEGQIKCGDACKENQIIANGERKKKHK